MIVILHCKEGGSFSDLIIYEFLFTCVVSRVHLTQRHLQVSVRGLEESKSNPMQIVKH